MMQVEKMGKNYKPFPLLFPPPLKTFAAFEK